MARSSGQVQRLARLLRLLGDPSRLRILLALEQGPQNVGQLCLELRMRQPAVSHHLSLLRMAGMVQGRRQGKQVYYRRLSGSSIRAFRSQRHGRRGSSKSRQVSLLRLGPVTVAVRG